MNLRINPEDRFVKPTREGGWFRFDGLWRFLLLILIIVGVIIGGWLLFSPKRKVYHLAEIPLIKADEMPIKVKATDQGVPGIKHQDKLVYHRLSGDESEKLVEHILPDPEPVVDPFHDSSPLQMIEQYIPDEVDPSKPEARKEEDKAPALSSIADLIEGPPQESKPTNTPSKTGTFFVQLGSLKSHEFAESEWARLTSKHGQLFKGLSPIIQKVDLGAAQGIYHRLRTGPFESEDQAKKFCAELKEKKVECNVVR